MSAAGEKVNRNIEWVVDKLGNLLGYKRGHQDVVNLVTSQTINGATVLVGADGEEYPLLRYSVVRIGLTADTAALANNVAIPFDTIHQDDIGLTTTNWGTYKNRVYYPITAKYIRASFRVAYAYVGAVPTTSSGVAHRGAKLLNYIESGAIAIDGLDGTTIVPALVVGTTEEGTIHSVSARVNTTGQLFDDNNWVQLNTQHNATASAVIEGTSAVVGRRGYLQLEVWE